MGFKYDLETGKYRLSNFRGWEDLKKDLPAEAYLAQRDIVSHVYSLEFFIFLVFEGALYCKGHSRGYWMGGLSYKYYSFNTSLRRWFQVESPTDDLINQFKEQ